MSLDRVSGGHVSGTHIAIDEAHLYIPSAENVEKRRAWRNWLREIGHHGATVEFITQNLEGLDKQVDKISELRYTISSRVSDLDFLLRIPMADWYELKGGLCGEWRPWIQQFEKRRVDKGWSNAARKMAELRPEFFELYESFSRPQAEEGDGGEAVHVVEHEFQRRSFPSLLWWFIRRHFERLFAAVAVLCLGVWMCFGGGVPLVLMWFLSFVKQFTNSEASAAPEQVEQVESVGYGPDRGKPEVGSELVDAAPDGSGLELPLETVVWSGPEGVITVKDYSSLADEVRFLETQAAVQAEELEKFRKETGEVICDDSRARDFSRVGSAWVLDRKSVGVAKPMYTLLRFSFPRREVLLSDGTVLTLRVSERKGSSIFPQASGAVNQIEAVPVLEAMEAEEEGVLVTMAAVEMGMPEMMRALSMETGASVIWEEDLDQALISLEVNQVPLEVVMEHIARRLGVGLSMEGDLYFLGQLMPEDRAVMVVQVGRWDQKTVTEALGTVVTQNGSVWVSPDGVCVVSEQVGTLRKVESLLNGLQAFQAGGWIVQLLLVEASGSSSVSLGIDTDLDIEVSAAFSSTSSTAEYGGTARAALKADIESQRVELFAQPLLLCVDGGESSVKRVEVVPVAEYTTLETGAVVTSGYSEIEVGLQCKVGVRADGDGGALVNYDVSLGEIQAYVDNRVPVRTQETLAGEVVMQSGGTYLLGSLERGRAREGRDGVFQLARSTTREGTRLEVWAMAVEVRKSSGVIGGAGFNRRGV